jgi:DNA-binding response OmpR family regulator
VRALLVLRDATPTRRLGEALGRSGIDANASSEPGLAEHRATEHAIEVIVYDASLVDEAFLSRVRRQRQGTPLIAWLEISSSTRTAELLEAGADEVVHGGMGDDEVVARVTAAVRRSASDPAPAIEVGPLTIDAVSGETSWAGLELPLSGRERAVLHVLADAAGRTVRREVLYRRVWGYAMARGDRTVDVNVKRLRAKLGAAAGDGIAIRTQPGIGYRLELAGSVATNL